jgi:hypothetical protein
MLGKDQTVILHAVPPDEPDGYRGTRRRFWISRKGSGVAFPALLVAASVVVVAIVVGVSQLLPAGEAGQIPSAAGDPSGSAAPTWSPSGQLAQSPSGGVSPAPKLPGRPVPPPPTSAATNRGGRPVVPVEAEKSAVAGGARAVPCVPCSGGARVSNIGGNAGFVTVSVRNVARSGTYALTITYELGEPARTFYLSINGAAGAPVTVTSNVTDWSVPLNATVQVALKAGTNTIKFYNPIVNSAPDLDKVTV